MWTEEQFEEIKYKLDLRRSEVNEIKSALNIFPVQIEYSKLPWDLIEETWNLFEFKEYPIHKIILDIWCDQYLRDLLIDNLEDYCIFYDQKDNCIEITEIIEIDSKDWKQKVLDKVNNTFNIRMEWA